MDIIVEHDRFLFNIHVLKMSEEEKKVYCYKILHRLRSSLFVLVLSRRRVSFSIPLHAHIILLKEMKYETCRINVRDVDYVERACFCVCFC